MANVVEVTLRGIDEASRIFSNAGQQAEQAMSSASTSVGGLSSTIEGVPNVDVDTAAAQSAIAGAETAVEGLGETTEQTRSIAERMSDGFGKAGEFVEQNWGKIATGAGIAGAATEGFARGQEATNDVLTRMSYSTGLTTEELRKMATGFGDAHNDSADLAAGMEEITKRGYDTEEQLAAITPEISTFATVTGMDMPQAVDKANRMLSPFGEGLEDVGDNADQMARLVTQTDIPLGTLERNLGRVPDELQNLGFGLDDAAAGIEVFRDRGYSGQESVREFRRAVAESDGDMSTFLDTLGLTADEWDHYQQAVEPQAGLALEMGDAMNDNRTIMQQLQQWTANLATEYGWLADGAAVLAPVMLTVAGATTAVRGAMQLLGSAGGPIMLVVAAVAALGVGLVAAYNKSETFRNVVNAVWEAVKNAFSAAWDVISPVIDAIGQWFGETIPPILERMRDIFSNVWEVVSTALSSAWEFMQPILATLRSWVEAYLVAAFQVLQAYVKVAWTAISMAVQAAWAVLSGIFNTIKWTIEKILAPVFTWLYNNIIKPVWDMISAAIQWAWTNMIQPAFAAIKRFIDNVLAPAFQWFWSKVIRPVMTWIGDKVQDAWNNWIRPAFDAITKFISNGLGPIFEWLWNNIISPVMSWIGKHITTTWNSVIRPIFNAIKNFIESPLGSTFSWLYDKVIKPVWDWVGDKIDNIWNKWIKPAFDSMKSGVDSVGDTFDTAVSNIGKAWDKIKSIAAKPIHFVLDRVINRGLIAGFNKLVDWIPGVDGLRDVSIPGWLKNFGFADGGYTGAGSKYQAAGVVHADEYVFSKEATNAFRRTIGLSGLDYMNQTGQFPGYAGGGLVQPVQGPLTSRYGPRWGGMHSGVDWAVPTGTAVRAALAGTVARAQWNAVTGRTGIGMLLSHPGHRNTYYGHLSRTLKSVGDTVAKGEVIARSGNTGNSTGPHLHFETWTGGSPVNPLSYMGGLPASDSGGEGGGGFDILAPFRAIGDKISGWFKGKFPEGGIFVDAALEGAKGQFDKLLNFVRDKIPFIGDSEGGGGNSAAKEAVRGVAGQYGWDSGANWDALVELVQRESSWNVNAANPSSSARGLFQKMTSIHGPVAKTAAGQAEWGLKYIRDRYVSPRTALDFHNRNNWYDSGGWLEQGMTVARNATGRPEPVLTAPQWDTMTRLAEYAGRAVLSDPGDGSVGSGSSKPVTVVNNYYLDIGSIEIPVEDLRELKDVEEFVEMLKRERKMRRAHERGTKRSGEVYA